MLNAMVHSTCAKRTLLFKKSLLHPEKLLSFPKQVNPLSAFILTSYKNENN